MGCRQCRHTADIVFICIPWKLRDRATSTQRHLQHPQGRSVGRMLSGQCCQHRRRERGGLLPALRRDWSWGRGWRRWHPSRFLCGRMRERHKTNQDLSRHFKTCMHTSCAAHGTLKLAISHGNVNVTDNDKFGYAMNFPPRYDFGHQDASGFYALATTASWSSCITSLPADSFEMARDKKLRCWDVLFQLGISSFMQLPTLSRTVFIYTQRPYTNTHTHTKYMRTIFIHTHIYVCNYTRTYIIYIYILQLYY